MQMKVCPVCSKNFIKDYRISRKTWEKRIYCSRQCADIGKIPRNKGKHIWQYKEHPRGMLGKTPWNKGLKGKQVGWNKGTKLLPQISGKNSHKWKGGKLKTQDGYILIYSPNHPRTQNQKRPYVFEHILVAEKKIGRFLLDNEIVHHINEVTNDNRPENLFITTRAKHLKQHNPLQFRTRERMEKYWNTIRGRTCCICSKPYFGKGYCNEHYRRIIIGQKPKISFQQIEDIERGVAEVDVTEVK
jgi:hypothetical protein